MLKQNIQEPFLITCIRLAVMGEILSSCLPNEAKFSQQLLHFLLFFGAFFESPIKSWLYGKRKVGVQMI